MRKRFTLALLSLLLVPLGMMAQDVTIRGNNGSTIPAIKSGNTTDTFFGSGGFATWQHNQLSMVLTVSDNTDLTPNKQLDNPANNLFVTSDGKLIQIGKGQVTNANVTYVSLSLPQGYRFTGYEIKFSKSTETKTANFGSTFSTDFNSPVTSVFGETGENFGTYTVSAEVTNDGGSQTIKREEGAGGTMSNVLYFKLMNTTTDEGEERGWHYVDGEWIYVEEDRAANNRALITLESATFYFTAEENYAPVLPTTDVAKVSAVDIPFSTSKVDYGNIQRNGYTIDGRTYYRVSYNSADITDLQAYLHLYEEESTTTGTDIDGIRGQIVDYKAGTISNEGDFFKLGREDKEQIYFIETPTYVTLSNDVKNPVGYRITGAKFEYANQITASRTFYITHVYNGSTYYLYTNGSSVTWETSTNRRTIWTMDEDGYISGGGYYLVFNQAYAGIQSSKPGESERYAIGEDGIYQIGWPDYYIRWYRQNRTNYCRVDRNGDEGDKATYTERSTSTEEHDFTLKVYNADGESLYDTRTDGNGTVVLNGLNNDAVKFGVQGIGLIKATLTLQALDPYLDQMSVVCVDKHPEKVKPVIGEDGQPVIGEDGQPVKEPAIRLSQTFTASDFSVSGGEFFFYLPGDCATDPVDITFEDLKSKYFDETYTGGSASHTSRLNFVKSDHYNAFGNVHPNVIYNDRAEAASATPLERLKVGTVGTAPFKFNNVDQVGTSGGTVTEYPFSLQKYEDAPNGGSFGDLKFTVTDEDQEATRYVFTTDETRYNIAPTTATQHRAYAFYEMIIHVQTLTYKPKVKFEKVYDNTLYRDKDGNVKTNSFYGAKVTAYDNNTPPKAGYSSTAEIYNTIDAAIKRGTDDFNTSFPDLKGPDQLLYLDFSEMAGIYQTTTDEHGSMEEFAATNAPNCLIFIPVGASAPNNNVAYKTAAGSFRAAQNIVLNDMQPFYSPYDIQVDAAKQASYQRRLTTDKYGAAQHFSIIMPYQLKVEDGVHTNIDGSTFTVHSMQPTNAISLDSESGNTYAYMPSLQGVSVTTPNMPYFIQMPKEVAENTITITQNGTLIKATKTAAADETAGTQAVTYNSNYTLTGPSSTGSVSNGTAKGEYTFTPTGTYAGIEVPKDDKIFYFANNEFVNSVDYKYAGGKIKFAPFRAYLATTGSSMNPMIHNMQVVFGENPNSETDGIDMLAVPVDVDMNAPVFDLQGRKMADGLKDAHLAKGIYVINGVKVIVK